MRRSTKLQATADYGPWPARSPGRAHDWLGTSLARKAAALTAATLLSTATVAFLLWGSSLWPDLEAGAFATRAVVLSATAGALVGAVMHYLAGLRLAEFAAVIDRMGPDEELERLSEGGDDEVGAVAGAVNRLLARMTSIRASMIDQGRELGEAQRELVLSADLAAKTEELATRLEERALLFDLLRVITSSLELDSTLRTLVDRVGPLLKLREAVIFLHDSRADAFVIGATYGFKEDGVLLGRSVKAGEGFSGRVCMTRAPLIIDDLSQEADFMGFWGQAERRGSLAAVPIIYQNQLLGALTVTRPEEDPMTEVQRNLLSAIADSAALAIRNAQLFRRMRELSSHDELTGLPNRRWFHTQLEHEIERTRRFDKPLSLLVIQIDAVEQLSRERGRDAADSALLRLGQAIAQAVRRVDTVARVDTGLFMVLLPGADAQAAVSVADKLRDTIHQQARAAVPDDPARLSVRVGLSSMLPDDDRAGARLLARATESLGAR